MKLFRTMGAALLALVTAGALAQTYPTANPTYIPAALVASTTISATGTAVTSQLNGLETLYVRIVGTPSAMATAVQATESRGDSPTWTTQSVTNMATGAQAQSITAAGLYRLNTAGLAQVRMSTTTLNTGTFAVTMSGGLGNTQTTVAPAERRTYSSTVTATTPAATATDVITIYGNASTVVRLHAVECTGQGTSTTAVTLDLVKYSTAASGGTGTVTTVVSHDALSAAASSTPMVYTANPTSGTLVGTLATGRLVTSTDATPTDAVPVRWTFGDQAYAQPITLRGTAQGVAINGRSATLAVGTTLSCSLTWTEE